LVPLAYCSFIERPGAWRAAGVAGSVLLLASVRPEGPILVMCGVAAMVAYAGLERRRGEPAVVHGRLANTVVVAAISVAICAALVGWRFHYFGELFPHAVGVKTGGDARPLDGLASLFDNLRVSNVAFFAASITGIAYALYTSARSTDTRALASTGAFAFAQVAFAVGSGGDWMGFGRFLAPAVPLFAILTITWSSAFGEARRAVALALVIVLTGGNLILCVDLLRGYGMGHPVWAVGPAARALHDTGNGRYSFAETATPHLRDGLALAALLPIVARATEASDEPVVLASGQAGMIPYHVFSEFYGQVRFVDLYSLTTNEIDPCLPERDEGHSKWGVLISLDWMIEHAETIERVCGIPKPHIVYNSGAKRANLVKLEKSGYKIVYVQKGRDQLSRDQGFVRNNDVLDYHIGVRADLAAQLGLRKKTYRYKL
jgi:hypothetical protein